MHRIGIRPNHLTLAQVPIYVLMVRAGFQGDLLWFGLYQIIVMILDGMDGTLARRMGTASKSGAYLDAVFDLAGIVLVVIVAAHLYPSYAYWTYAALAANLVLYLQNWWLDEKAVSYIRGPVVAGMYFEPMFPGIFWFGALVPLVSAAIIVLGRLFLEPVPEHAKVEPAGPAPYRPGFKAERRE